MRHYGDITKIDGHKVPLVDIVTGGSPCQDLSVAGKRAGLEGARSGLFMEQIRIIKEMRDESAKQLRLRGANEPLRPRYMVWENVPGAFSSNKGEDFRAVLEETAKIVCEDAVIPRPKDGKWTPSGVILGDGWSIAWRLHDAQFWGVPQRRKRIALVADFGGQSAPEILFESEGLSGDLAESREEGQGIATTSERNADPAGCTANNLGNTLNTVKRHGVCTYQQTTGTLCASGYDKLGVQEALNDMYVIGTAYDGSQISPTLTANNANGAQRMPDKENFNAVITYGIDRASFNQGQNAQYDFSIEEETAQTIVSRGPGGGTEQTIGALCARDYKGVGNQYVNEGKCVIQRIKDSESI